LPLISLQRRLPAAKIAGRAQSALGGRLPAWSTARTRVLLAVEAALCAADPPLLLSARVVRQRLGCESAGSKKEGESPARVPLHLDTVPLGRFRDEMVVAWSVQENKSVLTTRLPVEHSTLHMFPTSRGQGANKQLPCRCGHVRGAQRWVDKLLGHWGGNTLGSPLRGPRRPPRAQPLSNRSSRTRTSTVGAPSRWRPAGSAVARAQRAAATGAHESPERKVVSRLIQHAPRPSGWEPLAANPRTTPAARVSHPASPHTTFPPNAQTDPPHPPDGVPARAPSQGQRTSLHLQPSLPHGHPVATATASFILTGGGGGGPLRQRQWCVWRAVSGGCAWVRGRSEAGGGR